MKDNKKYYSQFDKFIFRSPTLPFSTIKEFVENNDVPDEYLKKMLDDNIVREAIFLASPVLYDELMQLSKENKNDPKYIQDLKISLSKYLLRMATRCTPFGLFAGFSIGDFGESTDIKLKKNNEYKSHTRFDMNYLVALSLDLIKNPGIRNKVKFYPNSSINRIDDKIRYVEYKYIKSERTHNIVAVDNSDYLEQILKCAEKGSTIAELSNSIVDDEIFYETAEAFVNELIESQLLISGIEPSITGDEYIHQLLDVIKDFEGIDDIKRVLNHAKASLENIDNMKRGDSVENYVPLSEAIKELKTEFKINYLFQTDLYKPVEKAVLDNKIAEEVLEGIEFLSKLTSEPSETNLNKFIERFEKKYGDNEVCILDALDPEFGIGFLPVTGGEDNPPLLEKLPVRSRYAQNDKIGWNKYIELIDKKIMDSLIAKSKIIELSDEDVKGFEFRLNKLAPTFSAVIKIPFVNEKGEKQIYISSAGGSSAANLIGRFCHADKETEEFVREIKQKEEEILKDSIVAEIVHLPQARVGNVLLHPQFHDYEIPYLARSNAGTEFQIQLDDIMLSTSGGKMIMRSKKHGKKIIPRLSNAHNYSYNAQPIYQFLCEMQFQECMHGVALPMGSITNRYEHIPRIVYKNIILHLAEWKVKKKEIEELYKVQNDGELIKAVTEWRIKKDIPKLVLLHEGDNTLFINLDNLFSIKILLDAVKGKDFTVCEFLFDEKNAIVTSDEGSFLNEFIISYYRDER